MARLDLSPLTSLRVSKHAIPRHNLIPNTSIQNYPLFIYHSCLPASATSSNIESHLHTINVVAPQWRYTMYSTTHFHSTTHEVLCIAKGRARLCFGGEDNPHRLETEIKKGDVIVIPAGVGHRLLEDLEGNFEMVGSYPPGKKWDMCYGREGEEEKVKQIQDLGWFDKDPLYGGDSPILDI